MIAHITASIVLALALWSSCGAIGNYGSSLALYVKGERTSAGYQVQQSNTNLRLAGILWATFYLITQWPL